MSRKNILLPVSCVLTMFLIVLTVLALPTKSRGQDKIVIGVSNCLSGGGADMGLAGRIGAGIAVEEINAAGGIDGKKIELIYRDDESTPAKGVSAVNELIFKQGVKVIMGANLTHVGNAVNKIINDQKVIFITIGVGKILVDPLKYPYTFRLNFPTDKEFMVLVKHMVENVKANKIGIMRDNTAFGQTQLDSVMAALKPYKLEPVRVEIYNINDTDMTGQLLKLKNAGAEQIIACGYGPDYMTMTHSFARIGWRPFIGSGVGVHQISFLELAAKDVAEKWVGVMLKAFTYPKGTKVGPEVQKFIDKIKAKHGDEAKKSYIPNAGIWYDMIKLYAEAVRKVKSQDPEQIKKYLESVTKYQALVSKYSFSPTDHEGYDIADLAIAHSMRGDAFAKERVE